MAVRIAIEYHIAAQPRTPFPALRDFPSRGNKKFEEKNREKTNEPFFIRTYHFQNKKGTPAGTLFVQTITV